jgi:hypothetical protein
VTEFHGGGEDNPGTAHPDRVDKGNGTAVDVDLVGGHAEVARGHEGDCGERLVDLKEVQVLDAKGTVAAQRVLIALAGWSSRDGSRELRRRHWLQPAE